jgi:hypothetical protein
MFKEVLWLWISWPLLSILCILLILYVVCLTLSYHLFYKLLSPLKILLLFGLDELFQDPSTSFFLPSYVKAQAQALVSLPSPPWSWSRSLKLCWWWNIRKCVGLIFELKGGPLGLWTCLVVLWLGGELYWFFHVLR